VKTHAASLVLSCLSFAVWPAFAQSGAQTTNAIQAEAMELLRRTIAEQKGNPNKVIRTFTNNPAPVARPPSAPPPAPSISFAELERQYLENKISAKQFQRSLVQLKQEEQSRAEETNRARVLEALRQQQATRQPATKPVTPAAPPAAKRAGTTTPLPAAPPASAAVPTVNPQQEKLSQVEARIEEMIRQKAARERAALTNAAGKTNNVPLGPQTKRQRLDSLLKQYVDGALSDAAYKEKRDKILAEP
jgi:hypothetical protein